MIVNLPSQLPASEERRYVQIARDIAQRISDGEFVTGDRLPPERELAANLSVSRTTLREAVLALELMRYVEIRVGSGVFVLGENLRRHGQEGTSVPDETSPSEILEARRLIEAQTAYLAARHATNAELSLISRCIDSMDASINDIPRFDQADTEFHYLIAKASGNSLLEHYVADLWQLRSGTLWQRWYDQTRSLANRKRSIADHRTIHRTLVRRQFAAAATAMQAHIDVMEERFFDLGL